MKHGVPVQAAPVQTAPTQTAPAQRDSFGEELPPPPEDEYPEPADMGDWAEPPEPPRPEPAPVPQPEAKAPEQPPPVAEEPVSAAPAAETTVSWADIIREAAPTLPKDISTRLDDEKSVQGRMEGPILRLEVVPGFLYGRFNRQDVLAKFSEAASRLAGRDIRAALSELTEKPEKPSRDIEELRAFKEVRFI